MADADLKTIPSLASCQATLRFDDAIARIAAQAAPLETEAVRLDRAHGRILAEPVYARVDAPRVDVAAMDGYAVNGEAAGPESRFTVNGTAYPGQAPAPPLAPGHVTRIFTGAPMPHGTERVIVQEVTEQRGNQLLIRSQPGLKPNVRRRGSDFAMGDVLLTPHRVLNPRALLVAAAADMSRLIVRRRPRVCVMATGDEIVSPGLATLTDFDIPDSLSNAVLAMAEQWGGERAGSSIVPDQARLIEAQARAVLGNADILVMTGGASVGERDLSRAVLTSLGLEICFAKVAIKPGKPVWYGRIGETHVLGLPGNPTAAMITARLFLAPLLCALTGRPLAAALGWRPTPLGIAIEAGGARESFLCADWDGVTVSPLDRQAASMQRQLASANALLRRMPQDASSEAGDPVMMLDF